MPNLQRVGEGKAFSMEGTPCSPGAGLGPLLEGQLLLPSESRQRWVVWTVKNNASIDSEIGTASLDSPLVLGWGPATHGNS